ncbi:MAG: L,D-transpeptidase family protein [Flavobacteriales bacterium]|nr:L,D-transpeptidase family protein [Flavobacteriales bacterium]
MRHLTNIIIIMTILLVSNKLMAQSFKTEQLQKSRVKGAYTHVQDSVQKQLTSLRINLADVHIYLRAVKMDKDLEVWVKHKDSLTYQLFKTYDFCVLSGKLGPKTMQGDLQVPEGFYYIDRFNPWSTFHLSLGINYPNLADKRSFSGNNLGGDIFIHGNCVSIGCIPITDQMIEELYVLAVEAKNNGQSRIPVHIFPFKMNDDNYKVASETLVDTVTRSFWQNLKEGYQKFEKTKTLPPIKIDPDGKYLFN